MRHRHRSRVRQLELGIEVCDLAEEHNGFEEEEERVGVLWWMIEIYVMTEKTLRIVDKILLIGLGLCQCEAARNQSVGTYMSEVD